MVRPSTLTVDFGNIRGLHSHLNAIAYHLETTKSALLIFTETQISFLAIYLLSLLPGVQIGILLCTVGGCVRLRQRRYLIPASRQTWRSSILWLRVICDYHPHICTFLYRSQNRSIWFIEKSCWRNHISYTISLILFTVFSSSYKYFVIPNYWFYIK